MKALISLIVIGILTFGGFKVYEYIEDTKAFKQSVQQNTATGFRNYLTKYPKKSKSVVY